MDEYYSQLTYRDRQEQAKCLNLIGIIHRNIGNYAIADSTLLLALEIRKSLDDPSGVASTLNNLSFLRTLQGYYYLAISSSLEAVKVLSQLEDETALGNAYINLANAYSDIEDYKNALQYNLLALKLFNKQEDEEAIGNAKYNIANQYYYSGNRDSAALFYQQSLEIFTLQSDKYGQALAYSGLGLIALDDEDYKYAAKHFDDNQRMMLAIGDSVGLFDVYLNKSILASKLEKHNDALYYCQLADSLIVDFGGANDSLWLLRQYAQIYFDLGDYEKASNIQKEYVSLNEALLEKKKNRQILELTTIHKTEELRKENELKAIESQQKSKVIYGALLVILLLGVGVYYYYQRLRLNRTISAQEKLNYQQSINELLQTQERKFILARLEGQDIEKKRLARELHDNLGSMMVSAKWQYDAILEKLTGKTEVINALGKANQLFAGIYEEVRRISQKINLSHVQHTGLIPALEELCNMISESGKINASINVHGFDTPVGSSIEIECYRILQELISNVLKHSKAKNISIQLSIIGNEINLMVEDDGIGFNIENTDSIGLGLRNIEERVEGLNGYFEIDSGKGSGTTVIINIPLDDSNILPI